MAEKRKLRAGREPAAKRRVSEAATPSHRKKASTPRAVSPPPSPSPPPPPEPVEPLPISIKDGEPVPVLRERQSSDLSDKEYQSYAESAVMLTALERSKKKWLSDGILVRYYTKPKKTKREQIEKNNPPKDSMTRVGPCDVTVGPHLFDAMIYTVKDPNAPPAIQYAPPPKQMAHYSHSPNFQQYQPHPGTQKRAAYPPTPAARPPHAYPGTHAAPPQQRAPVQTPPQPNPRPPQNTQPGQPAKPSPDPVIQMLATRAAADPELKALMRVVASSQASQEQLRAFQAHIDELNAIIKAREQQAQRNAAAAAAAAAQRAPTVQHPAASAQFPRPASPQVVISQRPGAPPNVQAPGPVNANQQIPSTSAAAQGVRNQPAPVSGPLLPAPSQKPAAPAPAPPSAATPIPLSAQKPGPVPTSAAPSGATPTPLSAQKPGPVPTSAAPSTPATAPVSAPVPTPVSVQVPAAVPAPASISTTASTPVTTPAPAPVQNSAPPASTPATDIAQGPVIPAPPRAPAPTQASHLSAAPPNPSSAKIEVAVPAVKQEPVTTTGPTVRATPGPQPALSTPSANLASVGNSKPPPAPTPTPQVQVPAFHAPPNSSMVQQQVPRPVPPQPLHPQQLQQSQYGVNTPVQSRPLPYTSPSPYYRPQAPPARPTPAPINYKSVVFEFTSPLTPYGSSTSGHAGSGDRYLFPEHSILEWLPNENTILASFLIVKKVDPNVPFPIDTAPDAGTGRKSKGASKSKKASKTDKAIATPTPAPADVTPKQEPGDEKSDVKPGQAETPAASAEKSSAESNLKEYWQPVTFRIHAASPRILEPLTRVVKPADEVRKYMKEIMDRAERAPDGFPAFRLPYEDAREAFEAENTPMSVSTPVTGTSSRTRPSKASIKKIEEESEAEAQQEEKKEEELLDFYGAPMGLPPLRV